VTVSERTARLDQLLREEISAIIAKDIADPRIGFVTVTEVDVTADLSHATVWVSIIGDEAARTASLRALGRAMPFIRHRLGDLRLRRIPELHLRHDDSVERGTRMLQLLDGLEEGATAETAPASLGPLPEPTTARGHAEPPTPARPRRTRVEGQAGAGPRPQGRVPGRTSTTRTTRHGR
jgi:ribosome-binding factor A